MGGFKTVVCHKHVRAAGLLMAMLAPSGCNSTQPGSLSAPAAAKVAAPDWQTGTRYVYATRLGSKLTVAGGSMVGFAMTAELTIEARHAGSSIGFIARVSDAKFQAETPGAQPQFDALATELDQPFGFATVGGTVHQA